MRMNRDQKTFEELKAQGWSLSHHALHPGYHPAGLTEPMQTRNGFEYIRIFVGRSVTSHGRQYQQTIVCKRESEV